MALGLRRAIADRRAAGDGLRQRGPDAQRARARALGAARRGAPATVARLVFPDGVRLEHVEVELARTELQGRLARPQQRDASPSIVVPEPRAETLEPAGHWVFVPVIDHACFVARNEDSTKRLAKELAVLPAALALDLDGWKRLMTWAPASLEPLEIELATTPLAQAKGRKALAEAERKRQAQATLESAARLVQPLADPRAARRPRRAARRAVARARASRQAQRAARRRGGRRQVRARRGVGRREPDAPDLGDVGERARRRRERARRMAGSASRACSPPPRRSTRSSYFDDFGALFADRPAEGGVDIGAAIRRHVVDGRVRVIGELTAVALDRAERHDVSLIGAMLRVHVPPTDPDDDDRRVQGVGAYWAKTQPQRPQIAPAMVPTAVDLARRYLPYRAFPGKAVRLLEELRVAHDASRDESGAGRMLGDAELYAAFSWATGIPIALLDDTRAIARRRRRRAAAPPHGRPGRRRAARRRGDLRREGAARARRQAAREPACSSARAASARPSSRARSPRTCSARPTRWCGST